MTRIINAINRKVQRDALKRDIKAATKEIERQDMWIEVNSKKLDANSRWSQPSKQAKALKNHEEFMSTNKYASMTQEDVDAIGKDLVKGVKYEPKPTITKAGHRPTVAERRIHKNEVKAHKDYRKAQIRKHNEACHEFESAYPGGQEISYSVANQKNYLAELSQNIQFAEINKANAQQAKAKAQEALALAQERLREFDATQ